MRKKNEIRYTVRISFFVFLTAYGMRKTSGATFVCRLLPCEIVPEMRNAENGTFQRISCFVFLVIREPVYNLYLLFDFLARCRAQCVVVRIGPLAGSH